ncbi:hypothetical protein N781_08355 [Pontibacillus halophilus JSM 076056 = DSM 19796]|uniref:NETI motif-containing protein n=1 Tax=Pontibacillus halophilus JSM 076056 = DSM 19796 TaxID=1385510 RepID=A0A0A5I332_9BACI|nr:NETI motif-containing protein [Pontibacillus halophilus]KGX90247.1 hypothetical protein N781_08355 [Pontibacillus halophilus JSM 076056 = DSM 19796]
MGKKQKFYVQEGETIDQCLDRIAKEGYMPVRRTEEPIFEERMIDGEKKVEPTGRTIVFEAKPKS